MKRSVNEDRRTLLKLIERIYDAALDPRHWPTFLDQIAALAPGGRGAFLLRDDSASIWECAYSAQIDSSVVYDYNRYYNAIDPLAEAFSWAPVGRVIPGEQLVSTAALRKMEYYNDFLPRLDAQRCDGVNVARSGSRLMAVSINSCGDVDDGANLRRTLTDLLPHLERAAQVYVSIGDLLLRAQRAESALDQLTFCTILLDARGHIVFANRAAEEMLGDGRALFRSGEFLRARSAAANSTLVAAIEAAVATALGQGTVLGGACLIPQPATHAPMSVTVTPLAGRAPTRLSHMEAVAAVIVVDPSRRQAGLARSLADQFRLSERQSELLALLVGGATPSEAAVIMGISISTVRTHLRGLLRKLDCVRQADLVQIGATSAVALVRHAGRER